MFECLRNARSYTLLVSHHLSLFLQDLDDYRKGCKFLPKINNEIHKNSTYKKRFSSLDNLVLIKVTLKIPPVPRPILTSIIVRFCPIAQKIIILLFLKLLLLHCPLFSSSAMIFWSRRRLLGSGIIQMVPGKLFFLHKRYLQFMSCRHTTSLFLLVAFALMCLLGKNVICKLTPRNSSIRDSELKRDAT